MKKPTAQQIEEARQLRAELDEQITSALDKAGTAEYTPEMRSQVLADRQTLTDIELKIEHLSKQLEEEKRSISVSVITDAHKDKDAAKNFRLVRAIAAMAQGKSVDGLEKEMHQEGLNEAKRAEISEGSGGYMVPSMVSRRALTIGGDQFGQPLVSVDMGELISFLQPSFALRSLGAKILSDLQGNISFPRMTSSMFGEAITETGALTDRNPEINTLILSPQRKGVTTSFSIALLKQSSISVENMLREDIMYSLWKLQETEAISGSGIGVNSLGILNESIGNVAGGTNGASPDWDDMIDLETLVANADGVIGNLGYLTTPGIAGKLKKTLVASASGSQMIWEGANDGTGTINGYKALTSTLVPKDLVKGTSNNCNAIIFGSWNELILAQWGGMELIVNPYSLDVNGLIRITANVFQACGIRRPQQFAAMKDALV